jgi:hypothetical protein
MTEPLSNIALLYPFSPQASVKSVLFLCHLELKSLFYPFPRQNLSSLFSLDIPNNLFNTHSKSSLQFCILHRSREMVRRLCLNPIKEHVVRSCVRLKSMNLEIS